MGLFGKLVKTVANVVEIPIAAAKDVLTLGGTVSEQNPTGHGQTYTRELMEKIKEDAGN